MKGQDWSWGRGGEGAEVEVVGGGGTTTAK